MADNDRHVAAGAVAQMEDSNQELHWLDDDAEDDTYENLDANLPNRRGRLPLHSLCATAWYDLQDGRHYGLEFLANYLIAKTNDIDAADANGIRPLHLASMMSEWMVKRLLTAGADPTSVTSEGLTALHLAARAREANIVGLLIDELGKVPGRLQQSLDAPDQTGRSPLFHACRSGRPESVQLLLDAGSNVDLLDQDGLSPFHACAEYEQEQALWEKSLKPDLFVMDLLISQVNRQGWNRVAEGGVMLHDTSRPWTPIYRILMPGLRDYMAVAFEDRDAAQGWPKDYESWRIRNMESEQDSTRLEEILEMLFREHSKRGTDVATLDSHIIACIDRCKAYGSYNSMRCFQSKKLDWNLGLVEKGDHDALLEHDSQVLSYCASNRSLRSHHSSVRYLLRQREYRAIEQLLRTSSITPHDARQILLLFVRYGFGRLLKIMLTELDLFQGKSLESIYDRDMWDPPLVVACQRELPNMDVVGVLVEQNHAEINAQSRTAQCEWQADISRMYSEELIRKVAGKNTALHEAAKGRHWWHIKQALPFLLTAGADRQQVNEEGKTPLDFSLEWQRRYGDEPETFASEARALLQQD
ncbi:hypothetical protein PFICI_04570 [Pestalotiopsis fici W106-1]|uniref:Uncharacterized protein n=1 Tax=Pestalotiopsis fici (strain W106-1 / CGMCC3.15140) TaxID=1229662 RepID=W3X9I1_PESFW|nr:uncharacterized protein PFICI_04570 [Pestalotiopsis fici W106-1]ETS82694.1 hypothetical protein PFICI_04570 [Pestalotiopsis fici W106-1]